MNKFNDIIYLFLKCFMTHEKSYVNGKYKFNVKKKKFIIHYTHKMITTLNKAMENAIWKDDSISLSTHLIVFYK